MGPRIDPCGTPVVTGIGLRCAGLVLFLCPVRNVIHKPPTGRWRKPI